jgi:DNA-binding Xre family transcriptional regulator
MKLDKFVMILIWDVSQIIIDILSFVMRACVLNQSHGHWLFFDALHAKIIMALKLKEDYGMTPSMTNLMEDDIVVGLELSMLTFNIRKQVCDVLNGFISFLMKYKTRPVT